jgi:hypothetical protein
MGNLPIFIFSLVILGLSWFRRPSANEAKKQQTT